MKVSTDHNCTVSELSRTNHDLNIGGKRVYRKRIDIRSFTYLDFALSDSDVCVTYPSSGDINFPNPLYTIKTKNVL